MKTASAKYQKRMHDRAELVDSVTDAFVVAWQGQEFRNGRDCDVIQANPNPLSIRILFSKKPSRT